MRTAGANLPDGSSAQQQGCSLTGTGSQVFTRVCTPCAPSQAVHHPSPMAHMVITQNWQGLKPRRLQEFGWKYHCLVQVLLVDDELSRRTSNRINGVRQQVANRPLPKSCDATDCKLEGRETVFLVQVKYSYLGK